MEAKPAMARMVVFPDKCIGCRICQIACSIKNEKKINPRQARIRIVSIPPFTDSPVVCRQCARAVCIESCPTKALYRDSETEAVLVNQKDCVGCGLCIEACPIGAIQLHPTNVAILCDLCEGEPACIRKCPTGALKLISPNRLSDDRGMAIAKVQDARFRARHGEERFKGM